MFKQRLTEEEKRVIQGGNTPTLINKLEESNKRVIKDLKTPGCDTAFLQGASHVIDNLLNILKGA